MRENIRSLLLGSQGLGEGVATAIEQAINIGVYAITGIGKEWAG